MAKLGEQPTSAFGQRLFGEDVCDYCGETEPVTYWSLKRDSASRRVKVTIGIECMLASAEAMTGFGYINQHRQWSKQSAKMKAAWRSQRKVTKPNDTE